MSISSKLLPLVLAAPIVCAATVVESCHTTQSASMQISDSEITTKVKSKMITDSEVAAHNIDVTTEEGIVYLMGRVATSSEKAKAERIARGTQGVRDVVNNLEIGSVAATGSAKSSDKDD